MKETTRWHSPLLDQDVQVVRWGAVGTPVLIFPTAGGDAEEIERFYVIDCLSELLSAGRIKVYSCDSVAGRVLMGEEGDADYQMAMQNRFHSFVYKEVVPAIYEDCGVGDDEDLPIIVAGSSIGAFNALAMVCRFPDAFWSALCLSGTFDLQRFHKMDPNHEFFFSSPVHFVPHLQGSHLEQLRKRYLLIASGEGRAEDIAESWRVAHVLGAAGVPNRVDSWGKDWHHDWITWREMFPKYVDELVTRTQNEIEASEPAGDTAGDVGD